MITDSTTNTGRALLPTESLKLRQHADSFDWGYAGDKAEQLALAILLDHTAWVDLSLQYYTLYKNEVIDLLPDRWTITEVEIAGWLRAKRAQAETKRTQYSHEPQFPKELGGTAT